jgi:hypothetical protein
MRRLPRTGFVQQHVWPFFGYYPWECPICRKLRVLPCRSQREVQPASEPVARD